MCYLINKPIDSVAVVLVISIIIYIFRLYNIKIIIKNQYWV